MKNILNLQVGDVITFTNDGGCKYHLFVRRITDKSCYLSFRAEEMRGHRESWNSVNSRAKYADFQIIKCPAL